MHPFGILRLFGVYACMGAVGVAAMFGGTAPHGSLVPHGDLTAWSRSLGSGLATGLALVVTSRLAVWSCEPVSSLAAALRLRLAGMPRHEAAAIALLGGLSEEILFRGALQPALGLGVTAAIFGMLHVGPGRPYVAWPVMAVGGGLVFGLLCDWAGNVVAPAFAHVTFNFLNLRYLAGGGRGVNLRLPPLPGARVVRF